MKTASVRELRNHGGDVLDAVAAGSTVVITRDGVEVAELRRRSRPSPATDVLIARRRHLPAVDPDTFRRDIDAVIDAEL